MSKKCLREENSGIINGNTTKWGNELKKAMEEIREWTIRNIKRNGDEDELKRIRRRIQITTDQEIQGDWNEFGVRVLKDYKYLKDNIGME